MQGIVFSILIVGCILGLGEGVIVIDHTFISGEESLEELEESFCFRILHEITLLCRTARRMRVGRTTRTGARSASLDFAGLDLVKINRTIRADVALLTAIVTFGILLHPFIPRQVLHGHHGACLSNLIIIGGTCHEERVMRGCSNAGP